MKFMISCAGALVLTAAMAVAQPASPPADTTAKIGGKTLTIKYSAPSVKGRQIFGPGGLLSKDRTFPVWRAGANQATAFSTDAKLKLGKLSVPAGNYTLFVDVSNPDAWVLAVNKQTGQWGTVYNKAQDLGRVKMTMSKPPAPVETMKWTISETGSDKGTLRLEWENHVATVPIAVK